ncbi:restriction endonuclease subunit S [Ruminococcus sp.]|uniref:restriction endonuclease subunit S n=1 Tax=Ruminococcus sp. TaxID=41978 RepID=UPI003AB6FD1F
MNEPKLRFKADDGSQFPDWEKKKLSDIFVERREMQCIDDEYKLLSFTIEQGVINPEDKKTNKRDFLMKDKASKKFLRTEYNDIIYNPANLKYGAINRNKLGKGLLSPIYAIFYTEQNAVFMESIVRNPDFIKRTLKYLEGTVIKLMTLKPRDFLRMKSYIPCLEEQQEIAEFLSTIDTVIAKQKETVSAWEKRKKGVMQKLFSQEVRFKADDGSKFPDWEEKKLGDICKTFSGGTPKSGKTRYYENGTISFIRSGEIHDDKTELRITKDGLNESSAKMVDIGDILYALYGATSGEVDISKIKGAINQAILCIRPLNDFHRKFIVEILRHNKETILRTYLQGGQGNLSSQIIQSLVFDFPCLAEQQKIADCLSSLDEVIEKQKATLAAWEELKIGLLQQMFV